MVERNFQVSIVIPYFNRYDLVREAVLSAISFCKEAVVADSYIEIVLVNDCSTDLDAHSDFISFLNGFPEVPIRTINLSSNVGATGAKMAGAEAAIGEWVVFLDSDDFLTQNIAADVLTVLKTTQSPLVFFGSVDRRTGARNGYPGGNKNVDIREFLEFGTYGECLPAVRRDCIMKFPYSTSLRGCEGLSYVRIIRSFGPCLLSEIVARIYNTEAPGRVSSGERFSARQLNISKYHFLILTEFFGYLTIKKLVSHSAAGIFHALAYFYWRVTKSL